MKLLQKKAQNRWSFFSMKNSSHIGKIVTKSVNNVITPEYRELIGKGERNKKFVKCLLIIHKLVRLKTSWSV